MQFLPLAAAQPEMASIKLRYERAIKKANANGTVQTLDQDDQQDSF
jgi:hypothetical protein